MPSAVLRIDGDTSGISRALGDVRAQAKATEKALADAYRAAGKAAEGAMGRAERASSRLAAQQEREAKQRQRDEARASSEAERGAQRTVAAYVRAQEQQRRATRASAQVREKAEKESTAIAAAEARKRGLSAEQEARVKQNALERLTRSYEAAERRQTAAAKREQRERERFEQRRDGATSRETGRIASTMGQVASGGATAAAAAHAQIQDARQQRAQAERALGNAIRNAGGSSSDVSAARTQVRQFVTDTGIDYSTVAGALEVGQGRGSALEAGQGETQADAMRRALEVVRMANAEGIDPGQLLAARGRLGASGLQGESLDAAIRYTIQAAQRGSVEVDQIIQQGLPGAQTLMSQRVGSLGPNATAAQRQQAALTAYRESVAIQEVGASGGRMPGNTANTLARLNEFLHTPRRQDAILTNISAAEGSLNTSTPEGRAQAERFRALRESMFERDPTRTGNAMRMKAGTSPLEFAAMLTSATNGNAQQAMSILAGGGHGNAQSLLANQRGLLTFLGSSLASGGTAGDRVTAMMAGGGISTSTIAEHQRDVERDALSELTRAQERGANALTDNTSAIVGLSNRIANFNAANPLASTGMVALGGLAASVLGPKVLGTAAAGLVSTGGVINNARSAITGRDLQGNEIGLGERYLRGQAATLGVIGGLPGMALNGVTGARDAGRFLGSSQGQDALLSLPDRIVRALSGAQITATVTPTDAAQAASRAPAPGR